MKGFLGELFERVTSFYRRIHYYVLQTSFARPASLAGSGVSPDAFATCACRAQRMLPRAVKDATVPSHSVFSILPPRRYTPLPASTYLRQTSKPPSDRGTIISKRGGVGKKVISITCL